MISIARTSRCIAATALLGLAALAAPEAAAQYAVGDTPRGAEGVGIDDKRGAQIPLDLEFTNERGETVELAEYFKPDKPVILTLNYYRCPMLCTLTLNGMVNGLNEVEMSAGEAFEILTVSFDPSEEHQLAAAKKKAYLTQYKRPSAAEGWHFLVGSQASIDALTDAVGFKYNFVESTGEWAHTSTIIFCTPDGRVSLYMDDVVFKPQDLRFALVEASEGGIGSALDSFALFMCFQYDPEAGGYKVVAWKVMRSGGLLTLMVLLGGLALLWHKDLRSRMEVRQMEGGVHP